MLPAPSVNQKTYRSPTNTEHLGNVPLRHFFFIKKAHDFQNLIIGKLGIGMRFPFWNSAFFKLIELVVGICSKEKMGRVYTTRVVHSGAIVTNMHCLWNRTEVQYPTRPMGSQPFNVSDFSPHAKEPISKIVQEIVPNPTGFGEYYFGKEPSWEIWIESLIFEVFCGNSVSFSIHRMLGRVSGCFYSAGTFLFSTIPAQLQGKI